MGAKRDCRCLVALAMLLSLLTFAWVTLVLSSAAAPPSFHPSADWHRRHREQRRHQQQEHDHHQGAAGRGVALDQVVFGIAGSAKLWPIRKELMRLWWRPGMRGNIWLEEEVEGWDDGLPPVAVSQDTSSFSYTNVNGLPTGIRISRIIQETFQMNITADARWFILCDDDTIFNIDNLLRLLATYDPSQPHYIGGVSESHHQNVFFSHQMAFGGGGMALSYPLAETLARMQDECLEHYPQLAGSDDRLHACISELGVPLTIHPGFHQMDIYGNAMGLLSAHPVAPFVSMHHVEAIDPIFPDRARLEGLRLLADAMRIEPSNFMQQTIGYDHDRGLTFSVSTGYVVQVYPEILYPAMLQKAEITFRAWNSRSLPREFEMDTRMHRSACKQPALFFLNATRLGTDGTEVITEYKRHPTAADSVNSLCWSRMLLPGGRRPIIPEVQGIRVKTRTLSDQWFKTPTRQCCYVTQGTEDHWLDVTISPCSTFSSKNANE